MTRVKSFSIFVLSNERNPMPVLIWLFNEGDVIFYEQPLKAEIKTIQQQIYVEDAGKFIDSLKYDYFIIPSEYKGEIVFVGDMSETHLLWEYPSKYSWNFIQNNLKDFHSSAEVEYISLLNRYLDDEY